MINNDLPKDAYVDRLIQSLEWGLDGQRAAWARALKYVAENDNVYSSQMLLDVKARMAEQSRVNMDAWFFPLYRKGMRFDLTIEPEQLWRKMIFLNTDIFVKSNGDPLIHLFTILPSIVDNHSPLYLSAHFDGWGIPESF